MTDGPAPDRLDRVRKLLAKAERAGSPEEAETYTAKAVELMARHGIDDAVLAAADPSRRSDEIGRTRITIADPYSAGKARLLGWTATAMRCRWVMHNARGGTVGAVTIFGFASDRTRVELLYTSLLLQIARPLRELRDPLAEHDEQRFGEKQTAGGVAAYRRSWLYGFAARIHQRIRDAEAAAVDESETAAAAAGTSSPGAALVLAERGDQVDVAYSQEFTGLRRARSPRISGSGFGEGMEAADRVDLGTSSRVGQAGRREIT